MYSTPDILQGHPEEIVCMPFLTECEVSEDTALGLGFVLVQQGGSVKGC